MTEGVTAVFRCSTASRETGEPPHGSASTVRAFVLVECPGPWGVQAVRDSRLPDPVKGWLGALERRHRIRPLLIRRPGRPVPGPTRVFAAWTAGADPWVETTTLERVEELCDLDPSALARGRSLGLERHREALFCVCTHGRHDACCAELGRPLCAALAQAAPEQTWEVSHIGGDRFAPNVLVLPHGLYYGRLEPEGAARFAADHLAGRLDLDHLRGRSCLPFPAQVAEAALRRHLDDRAVAAYALLAHRRDGDDSEVHFEVGPGRRWRVRVRVGAREARRLTCRASVASSAPAYDVLEVAELADG
jgi:hypothetical protein